MKKLFYFMLLLLIAPQIFAGPFDPPPTDQSQRLLGVIFGDSIGNLYLGGISNPVLSNLMEKFNFIMVVVGTIVVSYVAILSVINTAHEGTAMGKKWSAVWIPMRSVAGMALMVPAPASGYSMIQVTVMWIVLQGVGAADTLWNIALDGLANGVSATAGTAQNTAVIAEYPTILNLVQQVMNASICMQSLYQAASTTENINNKTWVNKNGQLIKNFSEADANKPSISGTVGNRVATMSGYSYFGVNNSNNDDKQICGKLRIIGTVTEANDFPNNKNISDEDLKNYATLIYNTKLKAISTMLEVLNPLAKGLTTGEYSTKEYSAISGINPTNPIAAPTGYTNAAAQAYIGAVSGLVIPLGLKYPGAPNLPGFNSMQDYQGYSGDMVSDAYAVQNNFNKVGQNAEAALTDFGNNAAAILGGYETTIQYTDAAVQQIIEAGGKNGWISAGSFYFVFNQTLTSTLFKSAEPNNDPITNPDSNNPIPSCGNFQNLSDKTCYDLMFNGSGDANNIESIRKMAEKETIYNNDLNSLAFNLSNGVNYLKFDQTEQTNVPLNFPTPGTGADAAGQVIGAFNSSGAKVISLLNNLMHTMGGGTNSDPLLAHALLGRDIMLIMEATFISIIAIILSLVALSTIPIIGIASAFMSIVMLGLLAILTPIIGVMWSIGAMLAIYCPLIPYMIFTLGALGWIMVVVEAIVAAPIIALGVVLPSGDDISNMHHALTILANIFLRPMLMVFGFILAGSVYKAIVQLIDFGMADVLKTIAVGTIFSPVVIIIIYVTFITSVTSQCFSLIYAIPDKILRWIGGSAENTQADLSEVKSKAESTAHGVSSGLGEITSKAGEKASGLANATMEKGTAGFRIANYLKKK